MEGFIRVNNTLINANRWLAVERKAEKKDARPSQPEHYLAVFDTGQQLMLAPEEGEALMSASITNEAIGG